MLICDRCRQTLTIREWLHEWCPKSQVVGTRETQIRHIITGLNAVLGERKLREAFIAQEMQDSYARTQP